MSLLEIADDFGKKNSYLENQNIFISGITNTNKNNIKWELVKI